MNDFMPRCLYCDRSEGGGSSFLKEAHVIPKFLGRFDPDIYFQGDLECDDCNKTFGDTIDKGFAYGTLDGLFARLYRRKRKKALISYDAKKLNIEIECTPLVDYSPLPFLLKAFYPTEITDDGIIVLDNKKSFFLFIAISLLEDVVVRGKGKKSNEYRKYRKKFDPFRGIEFQASVIGNTDKVVERANRLLNDFGLPNYIEQQRSSIPPGQQISCKSYSGTFGACGRTQH